MTDDFTAAPFLLDPAACGWVEARLAAMSRREKLGQLINLLILDPDETALQAVRDHKPGSVTILNPGQAEEARARIAALNAALPAPLLVSADLEGSFSAPPGTTVMPSPLGMAATDDAQAVGLAVGIMAREARAFGINWSFTPQVDVNAAFRSAITATRGFGSDPERVERLGLAMAGALQAEGVAACAKHWPGEGHDDRDQHLVTTVNPLTMAEWEAEFGRIYRALIGAGVMTVMSAHIALPVYMKDAPGAAPGDRLRPASVNRWLNEDLLRGKLGFRGLIVSDATPMAGLTSWSHRRDHVVEVVASGCDVILFTPDIAQDIEWLDEALTDGRLTMARVDQALSRQLALKAALGLHRGASPLPAVDPVANEAFARDFRARVPTLVHDHRETLPLSPDRHRRVLLVSRGVVIPFAPAPLPLALPDLLRREGFEVTEHHWGTPVDPSGHDLLLYVMAEETLLTRGVIHVDWLAMTGSFIHAMERPWHDVPVVMISLGYPYHLYDAPSMPCYVNAYSATPAMQETLVGALLGRTPLAGRAPIDAYCGIDMPTRN